MNVPRYASRVAQLLSSTLGNTSVPAGDRGRGVATIERAIAARRKSRVARLWLLAAATFALVVSTGIWLTGPVFSSLARTEGGHEPVSVTISARGTGGTVTPGDAILHDGQRLAVGSAVTVNEHGTAILALSTGTRLELEGNSSVLAEELARQQRFYLMKGTLEASVAKLTIGQRFIVRTPDAEVEVRGTRFRVEARAVPDACEVRTRLRVHEGVVEVRAKGGVVRVGAGESWPDTCRGDDARTGPRRMTPPIELAPPRAPGASSSVDHPPARRGKPAEAHAAEAHDAEAPISNALVEQNDLFAEGVAARRRGDTVGAIAAYGRLMQRYPSSALVENAMVERMRLLNKTDRNLAREEAQRYLERYSLGFARAEAERLISGPP
jgi:hypothetical protein